MFAMAVHSGLLSYIHHNFHYSMIPKVHYVKTRLQKQAFVEFYFI